MGQAVSCTSKGALLLVASANGDLVTAQELLGKHPKAASYYNFKDRSSPLLQAAARGHFELVQLILETAVMTDGPERAKRSCIDHANSKRQTALMVACKHGHPDCVEYLVTNGGDPLLTDERRHNTCLHFAALYGHSECVHKLLGSRAAYRVQGRQVPVAQIPCVDDGTTTKFIDRHNGWGLSALHIAVFQGSVSTVRALLRHGADLESVICASKVENSPIRCAVGSNALHIAALTGNIIMAKLILEQQETFPGLELRSRTNAAGLKPGDYAQSARNPVLIHLLDERLPVTLLRQIWMNYSLEQSLPPRHQTLGSMLQKLKLMFNLELISIQRNITYLAAQAQAQAQQQAAHQAVQQQPSEAAAAAATPAKPAAGAPGVPTPGSPPDGPGADAAAAPSTPAATAPAPGAVAGGAPTPPAQSPTAAVASAASAGRDGAALAGAAATPAALSTPATPANASPAPKPGHHHHHHRGAGGGAGVEPANVRLLWARRQEEITQLLATVTALHDSLKQLCRRDDPNGEEDAAGGPSRADRAATYEAVLDFILSTLITPRTVSAILHAAKKLVSASVTNSAALAAGGAPPELPPADSDSQHGLALLSTALRAVETCLQAAVFLTSPAALEQQSPEQQPAGSRPGAADAAADGAVSDPVVGAGTQAAALNVAAAMEVAPSGTPTAGAGETPATAAPASTAADATPTAAATSHASATLVSDALASIVPASASGGAASAGPGPATAGLAGAVSPRAAAIAAAAAGAVSVLTGGAPLSTGHATLLMPVAAGTGAGRPGPGPGFVTVDGISPNSAFATHWSAHLHTLIAQLQWDIGVQRHRRRRAHAAAAAARSAAAAAAVVAATANSTAANAGTPSNGAPVATPAAAAPATGADTAVHAGGAVAASTPAAPTALPEVRVIRAPAPLTSAAPSGNAADAAADTGAAAGTAPATHLLRAISSRRGDAVQDIVTSQTGGGATAVVATAVSGSDSGVSTPVAGRGAATAAAAAAVVVAAAAAADGTSPAQPEVASWAPQVATVTGAVITGGVIRTDEIIPLVSGMFPLPRAAASTADAGEAATAPTASAVATEPLAASAAAAAPVAAVAAGSKRGAVATPSKDAGTRGKDGGAGGAADAGGLDGPDDTPGVSDSGSEWSDDERNVCSICMDLPVAVLVAGCQHGLCVQCAFQLCVKGRELPSCPFCRQKIGGFEAKEVVAAAAAAAGAAAGAASAGAAATRAGAAGPGTRG